MAVLWGEGCLGDLAEGLRMKGSWAVLRRALPGPAGGPAYVWAAPA